MCKISAQYVKACMRKVWKTSGRRPGRTDGDPDGRTESRTETRTDGHHHTIIRPVWRRAYNKKESLRFSERYQICAYIFSHLCRVINTEVIFKNRTTQHILGRMVSTSIINASPKRRQDQLSREASSVGVQHPLKILMQVLKTKSCANL